MTKKNGSWQKNYGNVFSLLLSQDISFPWKYNAPWQVWVNSKQLVTMKRFCKFSFVFNKSLLTVAIWFQALWSVQLFADKTVV